MSTTTHPSKRQRKIALITGTSSGFGFLTALTLARKGYLVAATVRDISKQERLRQEAERAGLLENIKFYLLDVTDDAGISQVVSSIMEEYGRIDVLVNNAGFAIGGYTEEVSMEDWRKQMETNFFAVVAMSKAVLPSMRERGEGTIINISSVSGRVGFPGYAPYAASKFAVEGFSEALRLEMLPYGVRVVLVEPGAFRTEIWEKGFETISSPANSPYRAKMEAMLSYSHKAAASAPPPQGVADLIAQIAELPQPRLRYPIGQGSVLLLFGKAVLPWRRFERIITGFLNRPS
jgi:NAD(P)-dependent dehydrogenase (short-subunit alcohol dehydrogenase family)